MTVPLSHWPTPLHPAPRLSAALGLAPGDLSVERDDLTDLGGGTEGLLLDPVYTAKALAGLAAAVADGSVRPGEPTVFVHTGGLPGLFGHPLAAELAGEVLDPS